MPSPEESHTPASHEAQSSRDQSAESSKQQSREGSRPPRKRHNVRFTSGGESIDTSNNKALFDLRDDTNAPPRPRSVVRRNSDTLRRSNSPSAATETNPKRSADIAESTMRAPIPKPRPIMSLLSNDSVSADGDGNSEDDEIKEDEEAEAVGKVISQQTAQIRAEQLSRRMGSHSFPGTRYTSPQRPQRIATRSPPPSPPPEGERPTWLDLSDIPMERLNTRGRKFAITDDSDEETENVTEASPLQKKKERLSGFFDRAADLVAHHTKSRMNGLFRFGTQTPPEMASGVQTPVYERDPDHYVPKPKEYREGFLSSLLKLYNEQGLGSALSHIPSGYDAVNRAAHQRDDSGQSLLGLTASAATTPAQTPAVSPAGSPTSSGATTPKAKHQKWYQKNPRRESSGALSNLVSSSTIFAHLPAGSSRASKAIRPKAKHRRWSAPALDTVMGKRKKEVPIRIQIHIAETMQRQGFLIKICRALMTYGAPTHRLEGA